MNIVKVILDMFGGDLLGKLGGALGLGESQAKGALAAAVPAMLSGLLAKSQQPGGTAAIEQAVTAVSGQSFGDFGSAAQKGSSLLSGLFGDSMMSALTSGLGRFLGLGSMTSSILGMIAPTVLGALGKAKSTTGMGIGNLLASQQQNIVSALPSGLGNELRAVPGLGSVLGAVPAAAVGAAASAASGLGKWIVPLVLLGAAVLGGLWLLNRSPSAPTVTAPGVTLPKVDLPDVSRITSDLGSAVTRVTDSLKGITDVASAESALPGLKNSIASIDSLQALASKLPDSARGPIVSAIDSAMPTLRSLADNVLSIPGVGDKLKPTLDQLMTSLNRLAGR